MKRHRSGESGQVTPYVVVVSLTLFGFMALAIDFGFHFHARRTIQNAADPAVLAGAAYLEGCALAGSGLDPVEKAEEFAGYNLAGKAYTAAERVTPVEVRDFYHPPDAEVPFQSVYTKVERDQKFIFGRFLGLTSSTVPAEAQAVCGPIQEGSICPMWIEGDPDAEPAYDGSGNLTSAYGLQIGQVYGMKINNSSEHYGALDAPTGSGIDAWRDFIASGCEDAEEGETLEACEGCEVQSQPGDFGNPVHRALEGGGPVAYGLYEFEKDSSDFPYAHLSCDLALTVDPGDVTVISQVRRYNSSGVPDEVLATPQDVVDAIDEMTDPLQMDAGGPPCAGIQSDGTLVPELITESVQGRFMDIVMTDGACHNSCQLPVLGIMRMYIVCWTNQENSSNRDISPESSRCVPNDQPSGTTIYGVFANFKAPSVLGGGGLGTNPLSPKHVVLVR